MKIAIASAKGGTGKTTIATNLFEALRLEGNFTVDFFDTNVGEPDAHLFLDNIYTEQTNKEVVNIKIPLFDKEKCTYCGKCLHYCEYDAIVMNKEDRNIYLIDNKCTSCGACIYVCNDNAITEIDKEIGIINIRENKSSDNQGSRFIDGYLNIGHPFVSPIVQSMKTKLITGQISIIDTAPGTSRAVVEALYDVDYIVLVAESSAFGLHDLQLMVKMLNELRKGFGVVINRYHGEHNIVQEYLEKAQIPLLMEIPFKMEYARIYSESELLVNNNDDMRKKFLELFEKIKSEYMLKAMYR